MWMPILHYCMTISLLRFSQQVVSKDEWAMVTGMMANDKFIQEFHAVSTKMMIFSLMVSCHPDNTKAVMLSP